MANVDLQLLNEYMYSRKGLRNHLRTTIVEQSDDLLVTWQIQAINALDCWLKDVLNNHISTEKRERLRTIQQCCALPDIVVDVAVSVLYLNKIEMTWQESVNYLCEVMPHEEVKDRVLTAAEILAVCQGKLYSITQGIPCLIERYWSLPDSMYLWIGNKGFSLPMVCPPQPVTNTSNAGYLDIKEPVMLGGKNAQHSYPLALDVLNIQNQISWCIDEEALKEPIPVPKIIGDSHRYFERTGPVVWQKMLDEGNQFWLIHQYDTRGRLYDHGYWLHYQGDERSKSLLSFTQYEYLD